MKISSLADVLIDYIAKEKEVLLERIVDEAKKHGSFSEGDVREILNTLEEEGLVEINYRLTKCYVKWLGPTIEEIKESKIEEIKEEKGAEEKKEKEGEKKEIEKRRQKRRKEGKEENSEISAIAKEIEKVKESIENRMKKEEKIESGGKDEKETKSMEISKLLFTLLLFSIFIFSLGLYVLNVNAPSEHPQTTSSLVTYSESTSPIINVKKDKEDVKEEKGEKEDNEAIIRIDSYNYGFSPSKIEVEFGKKVRLILKNSGDSYTFTIKEYGISVPVSDEAAIEFVADKKGVFHYKAEGFIYPAEGMLIVS